MAVYVCNGWRERVHKRELIRKSTHGTIDRGDISRMPYGLTTAHSAHTQLICLFQLWAKSIVLRVECKTTIDTYFHRIRNTFGIACTCECLLAFYMCALCAHNAGNVYYCYCYRPPLRSILYMNESLYELHSVGYIIIYPLAEMRNLLYFIKCWIFYAKFCLAPLIQTSGNKA